MKQFLKKIIKYIPINFTKNQQYDSQTKLIIRRVCKENSNCVDIGCHKGEILDLFLANAKNGHHYAFEPIPTLFQNLKEKYRATNCIISDIALSNTKGTNTFNYVSSNPAYSGLQKRAYKNAHETIELIEVKTDLLDHVLPPDLKIDLIKIDVEGAELLVLEGAVATLKKSKPIIIFEHGLGASEFYNSTPLEVFNLLRSCGYKISNLKTWLQNGPSLSLAEFEKQYEQKTDYYFIAYV